MIGTGPARAYSCPQCGLLIQLRLPVLVPLPSGNLGFNVAPHVSAIALHLRLGCAALERRSSST